MFAYEAGPCGYVLYRYLTRTGLDCRVVDEQIERLGRIEQELLDLAPKWRLWPVVEALQALRGMQWIVAVTVVAELGDLTRFDNRRQLAAFVGLIPSELARIVWAVWRRDADFTEQAPIAA